MSKGKVETVDTKSILGLFEPVGDNIEVQEGQFIKEEPESLASSQKLCIQKSKIISVLLYVLRIGGTTFFFILFEIAFFILLARLGKIYYEFYLLQLFIISSYAFYLISSFCSSKLKVIKLIKLFTSTALLVFFSLLFCIAFFFFKRLIILQIILGILVAYYVINIIISLKSSNIVMSKVKIKALGLIGLIFLSCSGITLFLCFTPNSIEIEPKTHPEIIFWCGSNQLPDDPDILEMCRKYNIGFMPTIRNNMVGDKEYIDVYKNIIAHGINLYFCIGGDSQFFANIDNADEFPSIYNNIRQWFYNESIMDSPHIVSFSIDAEPPKDYEENMNKDDAIGSINYGHDNFPSQKEINEATDDLDEFTRAVEADGKECGMIRIAQLLDNSDNDGDLSLFSRNVYSLDIEWDYSITMLYRTNRLQGDESDAQPSEFMTASLSLLFGAVVEGTKFTNSELNFYQNVALLQNDGDSNADERYVFVGNFKKEFEDTRYIKKEMYKNDLDICRHFSAERVFFYELKGFLRQYGWEGIEELGQHNLQKDKWNLEYNNSKSIIFCLLYCGLIIIDLMVFIEKSPS